MLHAPTIPAICECNFFPVKATATTTVVSYVEGYRQRNLVDSNQISIVNQSKKCYHNPNLGLFNKVYFIIKIKNILLFKIIKCFSVHTHAGHTRPPTPALLHPWPSPPHWRRTLGSPPPLLRDFMKH